MPGGRPPRNRRRTRLIGQERPQLEISSKQASSFRVSVLVQPLDHASMLAVVHPDGSPLYASTSLKQPALPVLQNERGTVPSDYYDPVVDIVTSQFPGLSRSLLNLAERGGRASYPQCTAVRGIPT